MRTACIAGMLFVCLGCEEEPMVAEPVPQLECATVGAVTLCDDFADGEASGWTPEGGSWAVVDGRYIGMGPSSLDPSQCAASLMTASLRSGTEATNVAMHVDIGAEARADKTIVLRAADGRNRIELNFRSAPYDDLVVQELVDCELVFHTGEAEIHVPQPEGERIFVDVTLEGQHLVVLVNGQMVVDRDFTFANTGQGLVGVAVIDSAITSFDSLYMNRLL